MKVAVRRVGLGSLGSMGCLLGVVAALLPSMLCGLAALLAVRTLNRWLQSWQELTIRALGQEIARIDLVQFLGLQDLLQILHVVTTASAPTLFLGVLVLALLNGLALALIVILVGLAYNLLASATGGLIVDLVAVPQGPKAGGDTE